ncbi:2-hydroxyacid dehydrogenase [Albidovulum sediminicola]|uniref:D-glycerate dehydrogenase n=1 Tax=Albidovulum sediminicola TaxID=2984331 RepID=A0ABT2Z306_9RHOB|nr:D-glycerate dehydrogenase [Defluviimonas sp. WL0075]MCV2865506.1 D-glycerate dehydrogenase [Defluviimonas sp. WL0075]
MKLFVSRPLPDAVLERARAHFDMVHRTETLPMSQAECVAALEGYDIVLPTLGDLYRAETFAAAKDMRCRMLANFGVGYNHIDVAAACAAGIAVTNTPGAVTDATADIALTLILMSARRAAEGERLVRAGQWAGWHPTQMLGLHVTGKTVAIIGMGRIGKAIARRCHHGFGMEVVFFNRSPVADPGVPARQVPTLHAAMAAADIVVVAVPGGAETRHLIDATAIGAMRPHAHLVNIARGDVVEEAALIAALEGGQIGGAGLDVYEREPVVPEALVRLDNVTLLPHLGTAALEVRTAMGMMALDNAIAFAEGRDLPNAV